jgi:hypothetical protein
MKVIYRLIVRNTEDKEILQGFIMRMMKIKMTMNTILTKGEEKEEKQLKREKPPKREKQLKEEKPPKREEVSKNVNFLNYLVNA